MSRLLNLEMFLHNRSKGHPCPAGVIQYSFLNINIFEKNLIISWLIFPVTLVPKQFRFRNCAPPIAETSEKEFCPQDCLVTKFNGSQMINFADLFGSCDSNAHTLNLERSPPVVSEPVLARKLPSGFLNYTWKGCISHRDSRNYSSIATTHASEPSMPIQDQSGIV